MSHSIECLASLNYIFDALYMLNIGQNLLVLYNLWKNGFKVKFEDNWYLIKNTKRKNCI